MQWDATLAWMDSNFTGFAKNSTGKGNYNEDENTSLWKGGIALTGISEDYKVNNIYDLAGNVREWTMESYKSELRVCRGGRFNFSLMGYPASNRSGEYSYSQYVGNGFRVTLYIK